MRIPPAVWIGILLGILLFLTACAPPELEAARNSCVIEEYDSYVAVEGDRISLDVASPGMDEAGVPIEVFECVADFLDMPADLLREIKDNETVASRIMNNGWQHATFGDFDVSWVYNDALLVIIQEK